MHESERVTIQEGVVVGTAGREGDAASRPLLADVYRPPAKLGPAPPGGWRAILLVHGGAWFSGDRTQLRGYGILLSRAGYVVVACEYRLTPQARWPDHLHDVKATLRWMRANAADLQLDPGRIAVSGNSAGGHLALMIAGTPGVAELEGDGGNPGFGTEVAACVAIYAPTTLEGTDQATGRPNIELLTDQPTDDIVRQASPVTWVGPDFPPTLLVHGAADEVVTSRSSLLMYDTLRRAGVPVDLHIWADQLHAFDAEPAFGRRTADEILFFLDRYMPAADPDPPVEAAERAGAGDLVTG